MYKKILAGAIALSLTSSLALAGSKYPKGLKDKDFYPQDAKKEALGQLLAFDKILSGNLNISCLTCHHPFTGTGDGLALPIGEGGEGLGVARNTGTGADAVHERVPRNAPQLFNLGAKEFTNMFHDGRLAIDPSQPSGFLNPAGDDLPLGLDNPLAAQAMFPVTSGAEMAGQVGENGIADATSVGNLAGPDGVWAQLAERLQNNPEYVDLFIDTFADINAAGDITYVHAANAIAAFEAKAWRCDQSPYDQWLRKKKSSNLNAIQRTGLRLFYGDAGCSTCHSGPFQTDHDFHAIAMPQIGTGKGDGPDGLDDFGREQVTGDANDRFKFRTPSLRQIAQTAPYGHAGAYDTLEAVVRHHLDPVTSLENYDQSQAKLQSRDDLDAIDFVVMDDPARVAAIAAANELAPVDLSDKEVKAIIAFLHTLTDPNCIDLRRDVPIDGVPSGLTLFD